VAVTEGPEVLAVVVRTPCSAGEDMAGGDLQKDGVDGAILIVLGFVDQAPEKVARAEGEEEVLVVDVVQREHGAAAEHELRGLRLKAETFEWDTQRRLRATGRINRSYRQEKKHGQHREASAQQRDGLLGNRHGSGRVSLQNRECVRSMFSQTHERCQRLHTVGHANERVGHANNGRCWVSDTKAG
jgi:hypothetical protein